MEPGSGAGRLVSSSGGYKKSFRSKPRGLAPPSGLNVNFPEGLGLDPASKIVALLLGGGCQAVPEFRWVAGLVLCVRPNPNRTGSVMQGSSVYFWMCDY